MFYRCGNCQHVEQRGWLPSASCGLYSGCLLGLTGGALWVANILAAGVVRSWRAEHPAAAERAAQAETPWWEWAVAGVVALLLSVGCFAAIKYGIELVEYLSFVRRRCPGCGARRWSWGFTRGFGL